MEKEYTKMQEKLDNIIPIDNTIKQVRAISNLHNLIKNKGGDFNLSQEEIELAKTI